MSSVLVTGGSMGIGLAAAHELARRGHRLILVARGADALERACASLPGAGHAWRALDVSDERAWASVVLDELHGLVCAAAVIDPVGAIGEYDLGAFRRTLEINVCGTLFAVHHCLPALRADGGAIVTFSGGGGTAPLPRYDAYATSKAAVVRLTENLAAELAPIKINSVAPGFVATRMHESTLAAGPQLAGRDYYERTLRDLEAGGVPATEAAELVCALLAGVPFTGKLISAQWDPWRDPEFHKRLAAESSLATVRRIDGMLFGSAESPPQG
jgi:NAD(P)-dependent dehydrogenase (short-subunit alcohol dehydrogenase family)